MNFAHLLASKFAICYKIICAKVIPMHTMRLPPEQLSEFMQLFPGKHRIKTASEYEFGRYNVDGTLIVVYSSGKVVFSEEPKGTLRDQILEFMISRDGFEGPVIGSDEAGKGELLGPMVVAAVLLQTPEERALAKFYGAMDSKELSDKQLVDVSEKVRAFSNSIRMISPPDFNVQFHGGNLNVILANMHLSAIEHLLKEADPSKKCTIIIDKFGSKKHDLELEAKLRSMKPNIEIIITTKGERFETVAAASIIAKNEYEEWLDGYVVTTKLMIRKMAWDKIAEHKKKSEFCKVSYLATMQRNEKK